MTINFCSCFPPDVDVDKPDEKSIMTYVAKFLEKYPAGDDRKKVGTV